MAEAAPPSATQNPESAPPAQEDKKSVLRRIKNTYWPPRLPWRLKNRGAETPAEETQQNSEGVPASPEEAERRAAVEGLVDTELSPADKRVVKIASGIRLTAGTLAALAVGLPIGLGIVLPAWLAAKHILVKDRDFMKGWRAGWKLAS